MPVVGLEHGEVFGEETEEEGRVVGAGESSGGFLKKGSTRRTPRKRDINVIRSMIDRHDKMKMLIMLGLASDGLTCAF